MKKISIVVSEFNAEITSRMEKTALAYARERNIEIMGVSRVAGAFEIPLAAKRALNKKNVDGVVALGAIIRGNTKHDEAIANAILPSLLRLGLEYNKPMGLGILGPGISRKQAEKRLGEYTERAIEAVIKSC